MKSSLALLPSNRRENSVISDLTILENYAIAKQSISGNKPMINRKDDTKNYSTDKVKLNIKAEDHDDSIDALSGGNKQKVFIGRWLNTGSDILLFDNPTQGVDVGAKAEIYKLILQFAQEGKTIIINTLEIPEIQKVADRCIIFYEGRIVKELKHEEVNEHDVMLYSTSAINEQGDLVDEEY
jgi:ribose transport system ATP-binding protein